MAIAMNGPAMVAMNASISSTFRICAHMGVASFLATRIDREGHHQLEDRRSA
jgi:hypothetical protein